MSRGHVGTARLPAPRSGRDPVLALIPAFLLPALVFGLPNLVGYSGAPGTGGSCAVHCHGSSGGSILVSGFPTEYVPGDTYEVRVNHHGGEAISNFNASVRRADDTPNAGGIIPGPSLELYSAETDTIGVHFVTADQDSGWFLWIAPGPGFGSVQLYLSGMQGATMDGLSTLVRLVATEGPGAVYEGTEAGAPAVRFELLNRLVRDYLILRWQSPGPQPVRVDIIESSGRRVVSVSAGAGSAGGECLLWQPVNRQGNTLVPGSYFAVLVAGNSRLTRRFTVVR